LPELADCDLQGFILKSRSPSCGINVESSLLPSPPFIEGSNEQTQGHRVNGLFAEAVINRFPLVPVVRESELKEPAGAERFLAKLFILRRWRSRVDAGGGEALVAFHRELEPYFSSRDAALSQTLSQLVEQVGDDGAQGRYLETMLELLESAALELPERATLELPGRSSTELAVSPPNEGGHLELLSAALGSEELALVMGTKRYFGGRLVQKLNCPRK
jgi:hypothetical protein